MKKLLKVVGCLVVVGAAFAGLVIYGQPQEKVREAVVPIEVYRVGDELSLADPIWVYTTCEYVEDAPKGYSFRYVDAWDVTFPQGFYFYFEFQEANIPIEEFVAMDEPPTEMYLQLQPMGYSAIDYSNCYTYEDAVKKADSSSMALSPPKLLDARLPSQVEVLNP